MKSERLIRLSRCHAPPPLFQNISLRMTLLIHSWREEASNPGSTAVLAQEKDATNVVDVGRPQLPEYEPLISFSAAFLLCDEAEVRLTHVEGATYSHFCVPIIGHLMPSAIMWAAVTCFCSSVSIFRNLALCSQIVFKGAQA
jgi:hypothetical protein